MMPDEQRRSIVLQCEGSCLANVAHGTVDHAADVAKCVIDGWMNGLVRMEGEEAAAKYAFALADRVVNRAIKTTPYAPALVVPPQIVLMAPPPKPDAKAHTWRDTFKAFARDVLVVWGVGWLAGFMCGLVAGRGP